MLNKNLISEIDKLGLKHAVTQISKDLQVSKGTVSSYYNGNIKASDSFLEKFANSYNIPLEKLKESETNSSLPKNTESNNKGVPYFDVEFTAGFLEVENNNSILPYSYISHPFFKGCDYVVRASGQSMAKVICHGDAIGLVKINNWKEFFPFGEIYAIVTNDGFRMVKIITKGETDETYTLISKPTDSKKDEFPPQQIKITSILSIFKVQASSHLY